MKEFSIININLRDELDNKKVPATPRNNTPPAWVLEGQDLEIKKQRLSNDLKLLKESLSNKLKTIPNIISVEISEKAIAKSYRKDINSFFTSSADNILGMYKKNSLLYKVEDNDIDKIEENINSNLRAMSISAVENIKKFEPEIVLDDNVDKVKIKLLDFNKYEYVEKNFLAKCNDKKIKVNKIQYTDKINVYATDTKACLDILNDDELKQYVYEVEPMPFFCATLDSVVANANLQKIEKEDIPYINVGVLDSGIQELDINRDWILEEKKICYTEEEINRSHGTMVSTIILYGDQLINAPKINSIPVNLFDATVFGVRNGKYIAEDELILNIKETIAEHYENIKIWNLSLGSKKTIRDDCFSDFAMVLDELQYKYNILICKSAGNYEGDGENRICNGADSVLSLVVGALANKKSYNDIAEINTPSPFSRHGRAPANIIKPEVVHYGGNCDNTYKNGSGIITIDDTGNKVDCSGTSFSTPRITSLAASIQNKIDSENIDPLLLKALIIHSSNIPVAMNDFDEDEIIKTVGFGIPTDADSILSEMESKTTLVLRDKIKKKRYIEVLDFPYPDNLVDDEFYDGKIVVTLVFKPYLDQEEGIEYCQSDINIEFGTYNQSGNMDNVLENESVKKDNNKNILNKAIYSRKVQMRESYLIQYKNKYYPVKKYIVDLKKMTRTNKERYLSKDKKWYLKISQLFREKIEREFEDHLDDLEQEFCLIISFEDSTNTKNIHDNVIEKLRRNNFVYSDIIVKNDVKIHDMKK